VDQKLVLLFSILLQRFNIFKDLLNSIEIAQTNKSTPRRVGRVKRSLVVQTLLLTHRSFTNVARDLGLLLLTFSFSVVSAVVLGLVFYQVNDKLSGAQDRAGFLFFLIFFYSLLGLNSLPLFLAERRLYMHEQGSLFYSTFPFLMSRVLCDMFPLRIIPSAIFGTIAYWMIGLRADPIRYVTFLVLVILVNMVSTSACFVICSLTSSAPRATLSIVIYFVFSMLYGGLFINNNETWNIFNFIRRARYASFFHYGFTALMINEFEDVPFTFNPPDNGGEVIVTGQSFIRNLSIEEDSFTLDIGVLGGMVVLFQAIALIMLKYVNKPRR